MYQLTKNRDRKGKAIAKEELLAEILEVEDDSEDEELQREDKRKKKTQGKATGGWANPQFDEDHPEPQGVSVGRYGRRRGGRGERNRKETGGKRGRGQNRSAGGRGEDPQQEEGPAKKTRRSMEKRIRQTERAYQ